MDEPPSRKRSQESGSAVQARLMYVSELVGAPIKTGSGRTVGKIKDLVARVEEAPVPVVNGIVARCGGNDLRFVPWEQIRSLEPGHVLVHTEEIDSRPFERRQGEILLAKDLRDKEVIHVEGKRVVRANDVALEREDARWILRGVDVSAAALLAQLGLGRLAKKRMKRDLLPWDELEIFADSLPVSLHLTHDKISRLHPADIAKVFHELGYRQSSEILDDLPDALAADVVEDLAPEYQATLLASLDRERAADILEEMPPDAAADVLNEITEDDPEAAQELVESMEGEEAAAVERLRSYKEGTAGGIMTSEFVTLPAGLTVKVALDRLRESKDELPPVIDVILVVRQEGTCELAGILTLRALVLASPDELVENVMQTDVVVRHVDDAAREVARTIAHYNLIALPILDEKEQLVGVVSINQAMDEILPQEWIHRMSRPFIGGHYVG